MAKKSTVGDVPVPIEANTEVKTIVLRKSLLPAVLMGMVLLALASVPSYYFYNQYRHTQLLLHNPTQAAKEESIALQKKVGSLMTLPKEDPTVATVSDKSKLKDQPFFADARNDDKVLIYQKKKIAILYRPSINKLINVAPISSPTGTVAGAQTQARQKVALYNGTTTVGLASSFEKDLSTKVKNIDFVAKENAAKRDYEKTLVVDVNGNKKEMAAQLAQIVKGSVSTLPAGEAKPDADFLIIIGSSK